MIIFVARLFILTLAVFFLFGFALMVRGIWRYRRESRMIETLIKEGRAAELTQADRENGFR